MQVTPRYELTKDGKIAYFLIDQSAIKEVCVPPLSFGRLRSVLIPRCSLLQHPTLRPQSFELAFFDMLEEKVGVASCSAIAC